MPSIPRAASVLVGFKDSSSSTSSSACFLAFGEAPNPLSYEAQSASSFAFISDLSGVSTSPDAVSSAIPMVISSTSLGDAEYKFVEVKRFERGFATPKAFVWMELLMSNKIKDATKFILDR